MEIDEYQQYEQHPLKTVLQKFVDACASISEEDLTEEIIGTIIKDYVFNWCYSCSNKKNENKNFQFPITKIV